MERFLRVSKKVLLFLLKTTWIFSIIFVLPYWFSSPYNKGFLGLFCVWFTFTILVYIFLGLIAFILFQNKIKKKRLKFVLILWFVVLWVYWIFFSSPNAVRWYYDLTGACPIWYAYYPAYTHGFTPVCYTNNCLSFSWKFICNLIWKKSTVTLWNRCEYIFGLWLSPGDGSCW